MSYAITLSGVNKRFGPKVAVHELDLQIPQGSLIGLIGPNGAGKTTTIRMIMSIIFPDSGTIDVLGKASAVESKDRIGYLPEERGLYKKMKVGAFLEYVARLKGLDGAGLQRKVMNWLDKVGLPEVSRKRCEELSKGMQQKVQFIASVIHEPDLLILDEPFSGLDPVNSRLLRRLVDEEHQRGCTLIFSTHQMSQAEALCDRVVMIHQGRKVLDNTLDEIRARYAPREVMFEPTFDAPSDALARLASTPGVRSLETPKPQAATGGLVGDRNARGSGRYHAVLHDGVLPQTVVQQIASAVPVHRVEVVRPTLEDVFIEIVAKSAQTDEERTELQALIRAGAKSDASGD